MFGYDPMMSAEDRAALVRHLCGRSIPEDFDREYPEDDDNEEGGRND